MKTKLFLLATFVVLTTRCSLPSKSNDTLQPGHKDFFSPQAMAESGRWILVTNTAFHYEGSEQKYGQGFVAIIDRETLIVVRKINTTQRNPQHITIHENVAYIVNTGTTKIDSEGLVTACEQGGIDILDLQADLPSQMTANIPLSISDKDPRIGAYGSIVLVQNGETAFIGSGTRGDVFKVDIKNRKVLRGPQNPIELFSTPSKTNGMTIVRPWEQGIAILDYNTDQLCISEDLDNDLANRNCGSVGVNDELIEGPIDLIQTPSKEALVLMTIANSIYRVKTNATPFDIDNSFAKTGLANNRMLINDEYVYIVNSIDSNIQRIHLQSKKSDLPFAVLPVNSNPFDMVFTKENEGNIAWVSLFNAHQVALLDLSTGAVIKLLGQIGSQTENNDVNCNDTKPTSSIGIQNIINVEYGEGAGYGQSELPSAIQGAPENSLLSLGIEGELIVDFGEYDIVDGPGPDFIVFENPFLLGGRPYKPFAEPAIVGLSDSGFAEDDFLDFACDLSQTEGDLENHIWPYPGCAGVRPVMANAKESCIPPTDPILAGGDPFDLSTIGLSQARYIRLKDAGISKMGSNNKGFDLDAIVLINYKKR